MGFYTSGALLSDLRSTGHMGASTSEFAYLPTLALNRYGVDGDLPCLEMSGTDEISNDIVIRTDVLDPPYLPALEITAQTDTRINSRTGGMLLSDLELSALTGLEITGNLSTASLSATASTPTLMSLTENLSDLDLSSRAGIRCGYGKLPVMSLSVTVTGDLIGRLSRNLPGITITATGSGGLYGTLNKDLPPLSLSTSISTVVGSDLVKTLPALKISATGSLNDYGTLNVDLPSIIISAGEAHGSSMTLDEKISTLLMQIVGSGIGGGEGSGSTAKNASRFTDYVLRYSR